MATSWRIQIGYLSGYSTDTDQDDAWALLAEQARKIAASPRELEAEAKRFNAPDVCPCGCGATLREHCEVYLRRWGDGGPMMIDKEQRAIVQIASGQRELKEHVRRAFCRMLINAMHLRGIEVTMVVG